VYIAVDKNANNPIYIRFLSIQHPSKSATWKIA
jgi:hypothetical protein